MVLGFVLVLTFWLLSGGCLVSRFFSAFRISGFYCLWFGLVQVSCVVGSLVLACGGFGVGYSV